MTTVSVYGVGILVRIAVDFQDGDGNSADPTTVTLKLRKPDGVLQSETYNPGNIVKSSVGNYYFDVTVDVMGYWHYRWEGDGTIEAVQEKSFYGRLAHAL